ncbi:50S ribosomal protein L21 [Candidatus Daviesbacteria bacterium]|nr:50S ribosomal protein L21 [Candidatus Daviesbacteria bacterium]
MEYAIVEAAGKQYRVQKGDLVVLDSQNQAVGSKIVFDKVLLWVNNSNALIGQPYLDGVQVVASVQKEQKGTKIRVAKFRAKSNYRRLHGHRQLETLLKIEDIKSSASSQTKTAKPPTKSRKKSA